MEVFKINFCCFVTIFAARCYASAALAVMRCPSVCLPVCLSRSYILSKRINISSIFSPSGSHTVLFFCLFVFLFSVFLFSYFHCFFCFFSLFGISRGLCNNWHYLAHTLNMLTVMMMMMTMMMMMMMLKQRKHAYIYKHRYTHIHTIHRRPIYIHAVAVIKIWFAVSLLVYVHY